MRSLSTCPNIPNARQTERLAGWVRLHSKLYNAALQECIRAYRCAETQPRAWYGRSGKIETAACHKAAQLKVTVPRNTSYNVAKHLAAREFIAMRVEKNVLICIQKLFQKREVPTCILVCTLDRRPN